MGALGCVRMRNKQNKWGKTEGEVGKKRAWIMLQLHHAEVIWPQSPWAIILEGERHLDTEGGRGEIWGGNRERERVKSPWSLTAAALLLRLCVTAEPPTLGCGRLMLDPWFGSIQVQAAVLNVLVDLLCSFKESILHILTSVGWTKAEMLKRTEISH